jgi:hypothetical protein
VRDWNLVVTLPRNAKDIQWTDSLRYFSEAFTVTASIHLHDAIVGQLLALAKGESIHGKVLELRWPNVFTTEGTVHKARQPMGAA